MDPRRYSQGNLPKQIWGRKDRGLGSDVRVGKEEILKSEFGVPVLNSAFPPNL